MRYQLSNAELAQPVDVIGRRAHREPTTGELERLGADELAAVLVGNRFQIEGLIGRGGMATVYAAHDLGRGRRVALKVLAEDYCGHPQILARFLREARLTARLRHPNIVEVLDYGASRTGVIFLAMELLEGEDLRRTLARRSLLPWPRVRALMLDLCAGLSAAHAAGIIHRDLKPSNCFRVVEGQRESLRLVDFGIATCVDDQATAERLTLADHIIGTPEYMSPEQARGEQVDHRSDIYAAGLILGEMLTGALPFRATTPPAMLAAQIYEQPATLASLAPAGVRIPAALDQIYARALSKDPDQRYADIDEFAEALRAVDAEGPMLIAAITEPDDRDWRSDTSIIPEPAHLRRREDWRPYVAAGSIAFVIGALGALAVTSSRAANSTTPTPALGSADDEITETHDGSP